MGNTFSKDVELHGDFILKSPTVILIMKKVIL